mmetsp:Transcript_107895/g.305191  ORF Transcript_107895/g.305191 Transcript_107895/m.305191 type:complete len:576 (-) Transcript_107895:489-2216(-)
MTAALKKPRGCRGGQRCLLSLHDAVHLLQPDRGLVALLLGLCHLQRGARHEYALGLVRVETELGYVSRGLRLHGEESRLVTTTVHEVLGDLFLGGAAGDAPPDDGAAHLVLVEEVHPDAAPERLFRLRQPVRGLEEEPEVGEVARDLGAVLVAQALVEVLVDGVRGVEQDGAVVLLAHGQRRLASLLLRQARRLPVAALDVLRATHHLRGLLQRLGADQVHDAGDGRQLLARVAHVLEAHAQVELEQRALRAHDVGVVDRRRLVHAEVVRDERVELGRERHVLGGAGRRLWVQALVQHALDLVQDGVALLDLQLRELAQRLVAAGVGCGAALGLGLLRGRAERLVLHVQADELARLHDEVLLPVAEAVPRLLQVLPLEVLDGLAPVAPELLELLGALAHADAAPLPEHPVLGRGRVVRLQQLQRVEAVAPGDEVRAVEHLAVDGLRGPVHEHVGPAQELPDVRVHGHAVLLDEARGGDLLDGPLVLARLAPEKVVRHVLKGLLLDAVGQEGVLHARHVALLGLLDLRGLLRCCLLVGDDAARRLADGRMEGSPVLLHVALDLGLAHLRALVRHSD